MKYHALAIAATSLISAVSAFPKFNFDQLNNYQEHVKKDAAPAPGGCPFSGRANKKREPSPDAAACPFSGQKKQKRAVDFNAAEQLVDVTGDHAFVPPNFAAGDQRGPCPGLNALANHGYLPHNGVADMPTIISAVNKAYGMALDLGAFLAVFGTVMDGNPVSTDPGYSIGGPTSNSENILGNVAGLVGTPSGLSGSHDKYESDVSPTRGDLYLTGNNFHCQKDRFMDYYHALPENMPAPQQYTALAPFHSQRYTQSLTQNPYFFYSPFAGILVSPAGYAFPPRMMANHSEQYPDGYLSRENLASFFGVQLVYPNNDTSQDPSDFIVRQGWERIPDQWYRRPLDQGYTIPGFLADVVEHALKDPRLLSFGGNTGTTNSFFGVDIGNLTGGVFDATTLLDGNNLECLAFQIALAALPDILGSTYTNSQYTSVMKPLADQVRQAIGQATCPQLETVNQQLFKPYPGYTNAYDGYQGAPAQSTSGTINITAILDGLTGSSLLNTVAL